jgi:hypothetical protein
MVSKGLTVAVIILFLSIGIQPAIATVEPEQEIEIESKDYLFQTIIDISNNPNVKELLDKYDNDLFEVNIDKSVYHKLLLRNPRLFRSLIFTRPSISIEYLNGCYNKGIEIINSLGVDKASDIVETMKITDKGMFDQLYNFIIIDEEILFRLETLKEINKELDYEDFPIICSVLGAFIICSIIIFAPFEILFSILEAAGLEIIYSILYLLTMPLLLPISIVYIIVAIIFFVLNCLNFPWYHYF